MKLRAFLEPGAKSPGYPTSWPHSPRPEWIRQARLERRLFRMSLSVLRLPETELLNIVHELGAADFEEFHGHLGHISRRYRAGATLLAATQRRVASSLAQYAGECRP